MAYPVVSLFEFKNVGTEKFGGYRYLTYQTRKVSNNDGVGGGILTNTPSGF
jgi:hypothetical protein